MHLCLLHLRTCPSADNPNFAIDGDALHVVQRNGRRLTTGPAARGGIPDTNGKVLFKDEKLSSNEVSLPGDGIKDKASVVATGMGRKGIAPQGVTRCDFQPTGFTCGADLGFNLAVRKEQIEDEAQGKSALKVRMEQVVGKSQGVPQEEYRDLIQAEKHHRCFVLAGWAGSFCSCEWA